MQLFCLLDAFSAEQIIPPARSCKVRREKHHLSSPVVTYKRHLPWRTVPALVSFARIGIEARQSQDCGAGRLRPRTKRCLFSYFGLLVFLSALARPLQTYLPAGASYRKSLPQTHASCGFVLLLLLILLLIYKRRGESKGGNMPGQRRAHKKSRYGCSLCKERKIKVWPFEHDLWPIALISPSVLPLLVAFCFTCHKQGPF